MPSNDIVLLDNLVENSKSYFGERFDKSTLFELFSIDQILKNHDLSYEELEHGHVDGGDDGGIDGLYVFIDDNLLTDGIDSAIIRKKPDIEIVVITSKFGDQFKQTPVNSLITSLSDLFDLQKTRADILYPFSEQIINIREHFRKAYIALADKNPFLKISVYYTSRANTANINLNVSLRAEQLKEQLNTLFSNVEINFLFFGASELLDLARKERSYSLRIKFIENVISREKTNYIVLATLTDYYNFIVDEEGKLRRYLFEANVRDYLGADNSIVGDIRKSLESSESRENADFWWFSNGITLLASNALIVGKELVLENVQIVNGLQTSHAIYEHFSETKREQDNRAILLKIVAANNEEISAKIIKATNYQNAVDLASLRATDKIQVDIEQFLESNNWYYDRRKNYYKNQKRPQDRIISASYLGAAIRALALRDPEKAAVQKTRWMKKDAEYLEIFNPQWNLALYLVCIEVCKSVDFSLKENTKSVARALMIDEKQVKYIIGLVYLAKVLKNVNYTPHEIEGIQTFPREEDVLQVIGHIQSCNEKVRPHQNKKGKVVLKQLLEYVLNEFRKNDFHFLEPADSGAENQSGVTSLPSASALRKQLDKHLRLAGQFEADKQFVEALRQLEICLEASISQKEQAKIHARKARILARDGQPALAVASYEKALDLGLNTSDLFAGYARALYKIKSDPERIEECFIEALNLSDINPFAHDWYGTFLKSVGRKEEAEKHGRRALDLSPNSAIVMNNLALLLMEKEGSDNWLEAKELLERALAYSSTKDEYIRMNLQAVMVLLKTATA